MGLLTLVLGMLIRLVPAKQGLAGPPGRWPGSLACLVITWIQPRRLGPRRRR
jgi:hypothetical protein